MQYKNHYGSQRDNIVKGEESFKVRNNIYEIKGPIRSNKSE